MRRNGFELCQHIRLLNFFAQIVVGVNPALLCPDEGLGDTAQMSGNNPFRTLGRMVIEICIEIGFFVGGGRVHWTVIEEPPQRRTKFGAAAIQSCLRNEQMEERIVGS